MLSECVIWGIKITAKRANTYHKFQGRMLAKLWIIGKPLRDCSHRGQSVSLRVWNPLMRRNGGGGGVTMDPWLLGLHEMKQRVFQVPSACTKIEVKLISFPPMVGMSHAESILKETSVKEVVSEISVQWLCHREKSGCGENCRKGKVGDIREEKEATDLLPGIG